MSYTPEWTSLISQRVKRSLSDAEWQLIVDKSETAEALLLILKLYQTPDSLFQPQTPEEQAQLAIFHNQISQLLTQLREGPGKGISREERKQLVTRVFSRRSSELQTEAEVETEAEEAVSETEVGSVDETQTTNAVTEETVAETEPTEVDELDLLIYLMLVDTFKDQLPQTPQARNDYLSPFWQSIDTLLVGDPDFAQTIQATGEIEVYLDALEALPYLRVEQLQRAFSAVENAPTQVNNLLSLMYAVTNPHQPFVDPNHFQPITERILKNPAEPHVLALQVINEHIASIMEEVSVYPEIANIFEKVPKPGEQNYHVHLEVLIEWAKSKLVSRSTHTQVRLPDRNNPKSALSNSQTDVLLSGMKHYEAELLNLLEPVFIEGEPYHYWNYQDLVLMAIYMEFEKRNWPGFKGTLKNKQSLMNALRETLLKE